MKKARALFAFIVLMTFIVPFFTGCGESSHTKAEPEIAADTYPNAGLLVSGESLEASMGEPNTVIIDARTSGYSGSNTHMPGAINLIWSDYTDEDSILKPLADLESRLSAAGLNRNMRFVIYDDTTASWGAAGRIFWMLEYLGCTDVHILNGGWDKWVEEGRPTETTANTLPAATFTAKLKEDVLADKDHILDRLGDDDFVIIDPREDEEFNGWTLYDEPRGGHIPGAVSVNYKWFFADDKTVLSYEDLKDLLESEYREITPDKEVTSYCTAGIRSGFVYFALRLMGYPQCSNYDGSIYEWSDDPVCPMDKMQLHHKLVYPAWVDALIAGGNSGTAGTPPTYPGNGYIIVDSSSSEEYNAGHIPGAIFKDCGEFTTGERPYACVYDTSLPLDNILQTRIEDSGITHDKTVVVYGSGTSSRPFRVAWALMYAGVEDVRVLNGGCKAWKANGGTLETTPNTLSPVAFGAVVPVHPEYSTTTEDVEAMRFDPSAVVVDIRGWDEHTGPDLKPYAYFTADGHIPGAVYGENSSWYVDADKTLRSYTEVLQMWWERGITPEKRITFY